MIKMKPLLYSKFDFITWMYLGLGCRYYLTIKYEFIPYISREIVERLYKYNNTSIYYIRNVEDAVLVNKANAYK